MKRIAYAAAIILSALSAISCEVTDPQPVAVESVSISSVSATLTEGETIILSATVLPEDAANKNVTWHSDDILIASVSDNGKVTAIKKGSTKITVTTEDGEKSASCQITVNEKIIPVKSVSIDKATVTLEEDETITLIATVLPENASDKTVNWTSDDSSIASVDANGKVTAIKKGLTRINATSSDGKKTTSCQLIVKAKTIYVESVTLNKTELTLTEGNGETLKATVNPSNAQNTKISWSSDNTDVATVSIFGHVSAVKAGTANITVTTEDGAHTATCKVTVKEPTHYVYSVSLDKTDISMEVGASETLIATIRPENATNKNIIWSSSDSAIASVDNNGKVTANKPGSVTITATTEDGGYTATCKVFIPCRVESVSLDITEATLKETQTLTLVATVNPSNATNKNISWSSSDKTLATVDSKGKVTAIKEGVVKITVTTEDGNKTAVCTITITSNNNQGSGNEEFDDGGEYDW